MDVGPSENCAELRLELRRVARGCAHVEHDQQPVLAEDADEALDLLDVRQRAGLLHFGSMHPVQPALLHVYGKDRAHHDSHASGSYWPAAPARRRAAARQRLMARRALSSKRKEDDALHSSVVEL